MNITTNRIPRAIAVAVAGAAFGLTTTFAVASGTGSDQEPSRYHPIQRAAIAHWANEHHMSGLSPASLTSSAVAQAGWTPRLAAEMQAIADHARGDDLTGLSPASLRPIED